MIIRCLCYGYLGAVLAGLAVSVPAAFFGLSQTTIVAVASPAGIAAGLLGLSLPWLRRHEAVRVRARRSAAPDRRYDPRGDA